MKQMESKQLLHFKINYTEHGKIGDIDVICWLPIKLAEPENKIKKIGLVKIRKPGTGGYFQIGLKGFEGTYLHQFSFDVHKKYHEDFEED